MKKFFLLALAVGLMPVVVGAQGDIRFYILILKNIVQFVISLLMTVAIAIFIYGVVLFIAAAGNEEKIKSAKGYIIYGILGLFVLVAFWGLVAVLSDTFGTVEESSPLQPDTYVLW